MLSSACLSAIEIEPHLPFFGRPSTGRLRYVTLPPRAPSPALTWPLQPAVRKDQAVGPPLWFFLSFLVLKRFPLPPFAHDRSFFDRVLCFPALPLAGFDLHTTQASFWLTLPPRSGLRPPVSICLLCRAVVTPLHESSFLSSPRISGVCPSGPSSS